MVEVCSSALCYRLQIDIFKPYFSSCLTRRSFFLMYFCKTKLFWMTVILIFSWNFHASFLINIFNCVQKTNTEQSWILVVKTLYWAGQDVKWWLKRGVQGCAIRQSYTMGAQCSSAILKCSFLFSIIMINFYTEAQSRRILFCLKAVLFNQSSEEPYKERIHLSRAVFKFIFMNEWKRKSSEVTLYKIMQDS